MKYTLNDSDPKHPFKAPEGYFDELPLRIQGKMKTKRSFGWYTDLALPFKLSLAILPLIVVFSIFLWDFTSEESSHALAGIPAEDLIAYLDSHYIDIEVDEIASTLQDDFDLINNDESLEGIELDNIDQLENLYLEFDLET
jgi:hypothetical protein